MNESVVSTVDKIQTNKGEQIWQTKINADTKCAIVRQPATRNIAVTTVRTLRIRTLSKLAAIAATRAVTWFDMHHKKEAMVSIEPWPLFRFNEFFIRCWSGCP